jgi:hypothetical protein
VVCAALYYVTFTYTACLRRCEHLLQVVRDGKIVHETQPQQHLPIVPVIV